MRNTRIAETASHVCACIRKECECSDCCSAARFRETAAVWQRLELGWGQVHAAAACGIGDMMAAIAAREFFNHMNTLRVRKKDHLVGLEIGIQLATGL